jgi:prolipoprotein diacylglyceryl transferase
VASIPSPSSNGLDLGPFFVHFYGLAYVVAITAAVVITRRRWRAQGGDPDLVLDVAIWAVPAGILGGRLYHDLTSWNEVPHTWWGWAAVWQGGLGIWGGIAAGTLVGLWALRRRGADIPRFLDCAAPALLVAQAIGRIGNYFNQELFGGPTDLPWALEIDRAHRPANYLADPTFHPIFLYEPGRSRKRVYAGAVRPLGATESYSERERGLAARSPRSRQAAGVMTPLLCARSRGAFALTRTRSQ